MEVFLSDLVVYDLSLNFTLQLCYSGMCLLGIFKITFVLTYFWFYTHLDDLA